MVQIMSNNKQNDSSGLGSCEGCNEPFRLLDEEDRYQVKS